MHCFVAASINIRNNSGHDCHSKKTNYYTTVCICFPQCRSARVCEQAPVPMLHHLSVGETGAGADREELGVSVCICSTGIVPQQCHEVKKPLPAVIHQSIVMVSRKEICSLLSTCFNENALQYLKSLQSWLLFLTADRFMKVIFDEKWATRLTIFKTKKSM